MLGEIRQLYDYNRWANQRMLAAVAALPDDERRRELGGSFPSLHQTLVHLLGAEWIWLERWKGRSPPTLPETWDLMDFPDLRARWTEVEADQRAFVDGLTADRLLGTIAYRSLAGAAFTAPLWQLMRHLVNHSTYHRGQVATLLRQLGRTPAGTDLVAYYRLESHAT